MDGTMLPLRRRERVKTPGKARVSHRFDLVSIDSSCSNHRDEPLLVPRGTQPSGRVSGVQIAPPFRKIPTNAPR